MSIPESKKRTYDAKSRQKMALEAEGRILHEAKLLFECSGFEKVTIDAIAEASGVSAPTVYAKFKSKRGVLLAIIDNALPSEKHDALVIAVSETSIATEKLKIAAKLSRQLYDAEYQEMECLRGATMIDPAFKQLEQERETRRYQRQSKTVSVMAEEGMFTKNISRVKARDILWAFTGRDFYRMFVIERGWSSDDYEHWLADALIKTLL
jgi:AcrR family transcriptional regulator